MAKKKKRNEQEKWKENPVGIESMEIWERGFVFQNKVLVLCPGANTCDKGGSGNVDAGCVSVNHGRHLPRWWEFHINVMFNGWEQSPKQYPGRAACQRGSVSTLSTQSRFALYNICVSHHDYKFTST